MTLELIFLIIALILFMGDTFCRSYLNNLAAAYDINLQSAGLAFLVAACIVPLV